MFSIHFFRFSEIYYTKSEIIFSRLSVKEVIQLVNMGEKLKSLRLEKNLTQKQVADRIGLAISAVSSYESGSRYPSYEVLIQLARMFHVTTDYLLGITIKRNIDVTGLDDGEIELISQLVDALRLKSK